MIVLGDQSFGINGIVIDIKNVINLVLMQLYWDEPWNLEVGVGSYTFPVPADEKHPPLQDDITTTIFHCRDGAFRGMNRIRFTPHIVFQGILGTLFWSYLTILKCSHISESSWDCRFLHISATELCRFFRVMAEFFLASLTYVFLGSLLLGHGLCGLKQPLLSKPNTCNL